MKATPEHHERVRTMIFAGVYPHYVTKVEKKGKTKAELHQLIEWLTGYDEKAVQAHIDNRSTFEQFFAEATINPNAELIKGVICGYRIEELDNELTKQCRYLDKMIEELARGRKMEKILRQPK